MKYLYTFNSSTPSDDFSCHSCMKNPPGFQADSRRNPGGIDTELQISACIPGGHGNLGKCPDGNLHFTVKIRMDILFCPPGISSVTRTF